MTSTVSTPRSSLPAIFRWQRGAWLLRSILSAVLTVFVATLILFTLMRFMPGDPILAMSGAGLATPTPEELEIARDQYGLNDPIWIQYIRWMGAAFQGDFGVSSQSGADVGALILHRLPVTLSLSVFAMIVAVAIGAGGGSLAAIKRGKATDPAVSIGGIVGLSLPNFWLGLLLIIGVSITIPIFPASGYVAFSTSPLGWLHSLVLPAIMLGVGLGGLLLRQMRSTMIGELQERYVDTARMKGLGDWGVTRHAFRNSLLPFVTIAGLQFGSLISGTVVAEQLFVLPGIGTLLLQAVSARDYAVVQAVSLVMIVAFVIISFTIDFIYVLVDPRVKTGVDR